MLVAQKFQDMFTDSTCQDPDNPSKEELATAHKCVRDKFLATIMLRGANKERYGALLHSNELANQYGFGNDLYPKTINQYLTMMNRCMDSVPAHQPRGPPQQPPCEPNIKQDDKALVPAQGYDK